MHVLRREKERQDDRRRPHVSRCQRRTKRKIQSSDSVQAMQSTERHADRRGVQGQLREATPKSPAGQKPTQPQQVIPQKEFRWVTKETQMANSARDFKRTKYISPRQKISSGTPVAGAVVGGVFSFGTALALPQESWAANMSLALGLATGFGTWAGLMLRAKITGKFDM